MHARLFGNHIGPGKLLSLLLAFSLLFAALHVSQHDLVEGGGGPTGHSECQLSHVPGAQLCAPLVPTLLLVLAFVLALSAIAIYTQSPLRLQRIRAPPLPS
jgi:hypothetical protein